MVDVDLGLLTLACVSFGCLRAQADPIKFYHKWFNPFAGLTPQASADTLTKRLITAFNRPSERNGKATLIYHPRIPKGRWHIGCVQLNYGDRLYLSRGAVLMADSSMLSFQDLQFSATLPWPTAKAMLWAENAEYIRISGPGTLDGNGEHLGQPGLREWQRPMLLLFSQCKHVSVQNVKLQNAASWVQLYVQCQNVKIQKIKVESFSARNNDGIDVADCQNVRISKCYIRSDDDGIVLKSFDFNVGQRHVLVDHNRIESNCNGLKLGTESAGPQTNINFIQNVIRPSGIVSPVWFRSVGLAGVAITTVDGGAVRKVVVRDTDIKGVYAPLFIRLGARQRGYPMPKGTSNPDTAWMDSIVITNLKGRGERAPECIISGMAQRPITRLWLTNIKLNMPGGYTGPTGFAMPEAVAEYPEIKMFGQRTPASGLYMRHAQQARIQNLKVKLREPDTRPHLERADVLWHTTQ